MEGDVPGKGGSRKIFWVILLVIAALIYLQYAGIVDFMSKSETQEIIDRPHAN